MSRLNVINPLIHRMNHEDAKSHQYESFANQLVKTYQEQLGLQHADDSRTAYTAALKLLSTEQKEQSLRTLVQSLLLIIHSVKMEMSPIIDQKIPPASNWFDPDYPNNILVQKKRILNACF